MSETENAEKAVKVDEDGRNVVVVDPEEYGRTQKLKAIYKAKREYANLKRDPDRGSRQDRLRYIQSLIQELEPVMRRVETKIDYLNEYELGMITVASSDLEIGYSRSDNRVVDSREEAIELARSEGLIEEQTVTGLTYILEHEGYYGLKSEGLGARGLDGTTSHFLESEKKRLPIRLIDRGYRGCCEFMAEANLGLQFKEDKGPAQI